MLRPLEESELIFQVFHHGLDLLSRASQPKLIFDLLVIKTALAEAIVKLDHGEWESPRPSFKRAQPRYPFELNDECTGASGS